MKGFPSGVVAPVKEMEGDNACYERRGLVYVFIYTSPSVTRVLGRASTDLLKQ